MRLFLIFSIVWALLNACSQRSARSISAPTDSLVTSVNPPPDTLCFRQITGRDSTTLRLYVNGTNVTGELNVLPFEKDRARGSIQGKLLTSNRIEADWQRSGEGVTQPYEVIFTLKGDTVTWREGERIEKQGKWVLKNPAQGYEYVLAKTNCQ